MKQVNPWKWAGTAGLIAALCAGSAHALSFEAGSVKATFDSAVSVGTGIRLSKPRCDMVNDGASGNGAPAGCLSPLSSGAGDQGNLNYARGDAFTTYLKGNHELVLKFPEEFTAMARVNWLRDFSATHTTGLISSATPPGTELSGGLTSEASRELRSKIRMLDFWVSKSFTLGDNQARVRVGNQVVNWGESLFIPGGINATNAYDYLRLSQPGTQLKEAVLPAPMISLATGLGHGLNFEGYVQAAWNKNYMPPVGSYWSSSHSIGPGEASYGITDVDARNRGQWGLSLRWQPAGTALNLGAYAMNYHDKLPSLKIDLAAGVPNWVFPENRKLYGVSANFPLGDWAVGTEVSYRPKDAVTLGATNFCADHDGRCWVDEKRYQWHMTGIYAFTPANARDFLDFTRAASASLMVETVVVQYPNLKSAYGNDLVSAGSWNWGMEFDPTAAPRSVGTRTSSLLALDFSLTYDGTLIEGWQVTPELYYQRALSGATPNLTGLAIKGAYALNFAVNFVQNPANWQFTVNYGRFGGGNGLPMSQPLRDRSFVGAVLTRNF